MDSMRAMPEHREAVAAVCRQLGVERLDLFGSVTRADFGPNSDIDIVVRFDRSQGRLFSRYFDLKDRLERIFNRSVDVVIEDAIRNPYFRQSVERTRVNVYDS